MKMEGMLVGAGFHGSKSSLSGFAQEVLVKVEQLKNLSGPEGRFTPAPSFPQIIWPFQSGGKPPFPT